MTVQAKVLVAEDELDTLHGLERMLGREGYQVDAAEDGLDAAEKLKFERYDAVISDLRMPLLDGMDLLRLAKQRDGGIVFVMITAYGTPETAIDAMKLGATDFIAKPFAPADIVGAVEKGLKRRRHAPTPRGEHTTLAPEIRRFRREHAWAAARPDGTIVIGADEAFFRDAGEVVFCDLPLCGDKVVRGQRCARTIDAAGLVHKPFKSPLDGTVVEVNEKMEHEPRDARKDPHGKGWLFRIAPSVSV